jgi:hypothetical protein
MDETKNQTIDGNPYQKHLEDVIASLIKKYQWLDAKSEMYKDDMPMYLKLVDALTKVSAHLRDFLKMTGVRMENENDLVLLLAKIRDGVHEK